METELAEYLNLMESRLFGLTFKDLRTLAYEYAERNGIAHCFNKETKKAGKDWVYNFIKRNNTLSLRQPENTSAARAMAFNKPNIKDFFNLLESLYNDHAFKANQIYNVDETGITTVPNKPSKIIAMKGKKQVGSLASAERGTLVTMAICFNAAGNYVPPLFIFPRVRDNPMFHIGLAPESKVVCHPSRWMQKEIFAEWFEHFIRFSKPSSDCPILLILDGHATYTKNIELLEKARSSNVHIITVPPHTTHRMQPLDVSFMYPLNTFYEQEVKLWLRAHSGKVVTIQDIPSLASKAFMRAATTDIAVKAFEKTGIFPFNPHIFPDSLFSPSETTDIHLQMPSTSQQVPEQIVVVNSLQVPSTSNQQPKENDVYMNVVEVPEISQHSENAESKIKRTPTSHQVKNLEAIALHVSPQDILPIPNVNDQSGAIPKTRRGRKREKPSILTGSPYLLTLLSTKIPENTKKDLPKRGRAKKNLFCRAQQSSSSSSDDEDFVLDDSDDTPSEFNSIHSTDDDGMDEPKLSTLNNFEEIDVDDFLMVKLEVSKKKSNKYICKVLEILKNVDKKSVNVSFMRKYRNSKNIYVFPDVLDESVVYESEITGKLINFETLQYGKIKFE